MRKSHQIRISRKDWTNITWKKDKGLEERIMWYYSAVSHSNQGEDATLSEMN